MSADWLRELVDGAEATRTASQQSSLAERLLQARYPGVHGNAERLKTLFGGDMRYNHERKKWLLRQIPSNVWEWDDTNARAERYCAELMREILRLAIVGGNEALRKEAITALASGNRLRDILSAAHADMRIGLDDLDRDPDLLSTRDGLLDLRTGCVRDLVPDDFVTKTVPARYNPECATPVWSAFLRQLFDGDQATIDAVQVYAGYSLTARVKGKAFFLCYGPTNTGKSTLLRALHRLMGPYAAQLQIETLMRGSEHSATAQANLCDLRGARFAITSEVDGQHKLNVARLKKIVEGGGIITAARKFENTQDFRETHKLWIDSNYRPHIPHDDGAVFDRLHVVPIDHVIPRGNHDRGLDDKLDAERDGILAWCATGARTWYAADGLLPRPSRVAAAGAAYVTAMNTVSRFVEECCECGPSRSAGSSVLYRAYVEWARNQHLQVISQKRLSVEMQSLGFALSHGRDGNAFSGIGLPDS